MSFLAPLLASVGLGGAAGALTNKNIRSGVGSFLGGSPDVRENVSTLRPEQEPLFRQLTQAGQQRGAGGAFGTTADYYRNLLSDNSADFNAFAAPELRRYHEELLPGLSEQFAGMGSGGLNSSGFRNAQNQGAIDLSERIAQLRAQLRQSGAAGLGAIGQLGLQPYSQNMITEQGSPGFLSSLSPAIGSAAGSAIGGPIGGAIGGNIGGWFGNRNGANKVGANSSPYGASGPQASPIFNSR